MEQTRDHTQKPVAYRSARIGEAPAFSHLSPATRRRIAKLHAEGWNNHAIAREMSVSYNTVRRWILLETPTRTPKREHTAAESRKVAMVARFLVSVACSHCRLLVPALTFIPQTRCWKCGTMVDVPRLPPEATTKIAM